MYWDIQKIMAVMDELFHLSWRVQQIPGENQTSPGSGILMGQVKFRLNDVFTFESSAWHKVKPKF